MDEKMVKKGFYHTSKTSSAHNVHLMPHSRN